VSGEPVVGILVHGDNHFIVRGPLPNRDVAVALTRHWTIIQIGSSTPAALTAWTISTKEFRENLEWAVVVPGSGAVSEAVRTLLEQLRERGVRIHNAGSDSW